MSGWDTYSSSNFQNCCKVILNYYYQIKEQFGFCNMITIFLVLLISTFALSLYHLCYILIENKRMHKKPQIIDRNVTKGLKGIKSNSSLS